MSEDVVLAAIVSKVQALGYTTKLTTAEQLRSYDTASLPLVEISPLKRPTIGWLAAGQGAATRLYRLVYVAKSDLTVSAPLESPSPENVFKDEMLAAFQGINYTTYSGTPAFDSSVIDDESFDPGKAAIAYTWSSVLVSVQCLETTAIG